MNQPSSTVSAVLPHVDPTALAGMIDPTRCALMVVDAQVDFAAPHGLVGKVGGDLSAIAPALERIEALIAAARHAGATVAFMRVVTRAATDPPALKTLMARRGRPGAEAICRADGGGADYHGVRPEPGDIEIQKLLFNSFHGTDLDGQLRARGIETLVMTGFTTDCCVDATARDAFHRGYHVFVISDACAAYDPALHIGALRALEKNCALLADSDALMEAWTA